jgi:hypothetical protein
MAISDGSYKETFGTATWTIGDPETVSFVSGKSICPGTACDHDAYRSELSGIFSILMVMKKFCEFRAISEGYITLGCDGKSALEKAFKTGTKLFKDIPSYDLVASILRLRRESTLSWIPRFVKGHQDDTSTDLDLWAQRNILMDSWAKLHLSAADGLKYWQSKVDVTQEVTALVDWQAIGRAMKGATRGRRVFVSKHTAGMCGVGKFMVRWKQWETNQCPRCGLPEDASHVWLCRDPGAQEVWSKALASLELSLRKWDMDPTILHVIMTYLKGWQSNEQVLYQPPRFLEDVFNEQCRIGWRRFFEGWLSTSWEALQQQFNTVTKSNRTGKRWVSALIQKIWDIAWDLWEHRNGILHEKENVVTRTMELHLNQRVMRVFLNLCSRALCSTDRHLVHLPLSKLLDCTVHYKVQWLTVAEPALHERRRQEWQDNHRATRMVHGMRQCMLSWLSPSDSH